MILNGLLFVSNIYVLGDLKAALEMHEDLSPAANPVMVNAKVIVCFVAGILYLLAAFAILFRKRRLALAGIAGFVLFDGLYLLELALWGCSHSQVWLGFAIFGSLGLLFGWYSWLCSLPFEFADYPKVLNIHERLLNISADKADKLIDNLASPNDLLWPVDRWVAMQFDRPLGVGAVGGHGPIRYDVELYSPGCRIQFRFTGPKDFVGCHRFEIEPTRDGRTILRHTIDMRIVGKTWLLWVAIIRPLHNALLEDALDRAEIFAGRRLPERAWSGWVRFARWLVRRRQA
jgi:hypothetical protein